MRILRMSAALAVVWLACGALEALRAQEMKPRRADLVLKRAARPWEFLTAVGKRAGIFGNETGRVEAWTYPLKILRDFHATVLTDGKVIPTEALVRTIEATPEATALIYAGDTFRIRETFFVPVDEAGAVIEFDVETEQPLEIEVAFRRDFQLEWPASIGASYIGWEPEMRAFALGEETRRFVAYVGSPTGRSPRVEYETSYSAERENSLRLGVTAKGREKKIVVMAGSVQGAQEARETYQDLLKNYSTVRKTSADYYANYLKKTVAVTLPDEKIQCAYDWARVSLVQGLVTNPTMGTGLVAGYRTSGESQRPGFAWFFGRDSFWSSLALNSEGDFATTKKALAFIAQFQREDGKIPHEIAQGASYVNWFKDYPYGFASADATPLYVIAMNDYVKASGDVEFAKANWERVWKAHEFLRSTYDANGLPKNFGIGHGWVEGGPLLPVKGEFYQSGLAAESLRALANLAKLTGRNEESGALTEQFQKEQPRLNEVFWSAERGIYAFALDQRDQRVDEASVLATVPMWFGLTDSDKSDRMIGTLAGSEHETDWGMRIISEKAARYSGGGYHYGSVWPLFTGWASVGEYRYHHAAPAYANLRANALLSLDGSAGHVTEVLSGDYYQPIATSSPHQIWSAAMVISPILRGMLGLENDAAQHMLRFAPHIPANWSSLKVERVPCGTGSAGLAIARSEDALTLTAKSGGQPCTIAFEPALSLRAKVNAAELNGKRIAFRTEANGNDQHVIVRFDAGTGTSTVRIGLRSDFGVSYAAELPPLGSPGEAMRIVEEKWDGAKDSLTLTIEGWSGRSYELAVWNASQVSSVEGGEMATRDGKSSLQVKMADAGESQVERKSVIFHLAGKTGKRK